MTQHEVRTLEDGTRVYSNYTRYVPVADEVRVYARRKPTVPGAVRVGAVWFLPLELAPEEDRVMPETRPDTDAYDHMLKGRKCVCAPCQRPQARAWQDKWRRERGLTP